MQDRYSGDVGDYAKFGLIRSLMRPIPCERPLTLQTDDSYVKVNGAKRRNSGRSFHESNASRGTVRLYPRSGRTRRSGSRSDGAATAAATAKRRYSVPDAAATLSAGRVPDEHANCHPDSLADEYADSNQHADPPIRDG